MSTIVQEHKVVVFSLHNKLYAMDVKSVISIEKLQPITRVPNVEEYIKGVINLRGIIVPIIDLRLRLGFDEVTYTNNTRIIIVDKEGKQVGIIVDEALDILDLDEEALEEMATLTSKKTLDFIKGVFKEQDRIITYINIEQILFEGEVE